MCIQKQHGIIKFSYTRMHQTNSIIHIIFMAGKIYIHGLASWCYDGDAINQETYAQVFPKLMINTKKKQLKTKSDMDQLLTYINAGTN